MVENDDDDDDDALTLRAVGTLRGVARPLPTVLTTLIIMAVMMMMVVVMMPVKGD